jgi:dolichol kinase
MTGQSVWRNLFHFSGIVIPLAYLLHSKGAALSLTILLLCVLSAVEFLRITGRLKVGLAGKYLKEKEQKKPTGSIFYVVAALVTILLFHKQVAICSLLVLCISDPLSSLVGRRLGRHPLFGKSVEGTLAFLGSSLIILLLFSVSPPVALAVAFVATLTELFTPGFLDDNLTIPIATGFALTILGA